ncbi:MAG: 2-C-methyl-D-erythritol 2,4-cyclodiphosphate synthase [Nitriliruptorales bacterium]
MTVRVGSGLDAHAFSENPERPLVLAGVRIPGSPGLAGHSDADVVSHAVIDALLGAAGRGDLGSRFGADDPALEGVESLALLSAVVSELTDRALALVNVDLTVVAQRPRLAEHRDAMAASLAVALGLEEGDVSVKITSTDGLGAVGRGEGIACWATCLVEREERAGR